MKNLAKYMRLSLLLAMSISICSVADAQGIRKHYTEMTNQERIDYRNVMFLLNDAGIREDYADMHADPNQDGTDGNNSESGVDSQIHGNLEFLSWHRQFIREFEREIQNYADHLTIPYWDWTGESDPFGVNSNSINSPLWADDEIAELNWTDDFLGSFDYQFGLTRNLAVGGGMPGAAAVNALYDLPNINVFHDAFEGPIHNPPHGWVGGQMATADSPRDPVFYLHHAMIDKIWQNWTEIPGHNSGFDDQHMPTWNGDVDGFPFIDQNSLTDSRLLGIFYSNAAAGKTILDAYTVTNAVRPVEKFNYQYRIEAQNGFTIPSGKTAQFRSCNKIVLKPGFVAKLGSSFLARIDADCDFSTLQMVSNGKGHTTADANERVAPLVSEKGMSLRNYPNPFLYETTIEYSLATDGEISLVLYNMMGLVAKILVDEQLQEKGIHQVSLSATDLSTGIYYCRLSENDNSQTIPILIQ